VHDDGSLAIWVGTSMCVPGIAPPVVWTGCLLADGAIANGLPIDVMHELGRGPIIASDVAGGGGLDAPGIAGPDPEALLHRRSNPSRVSLFALLAGGFAATRDNGPRGRDDLADLHLRMPVQGVRMFDRKGIEMLVERSHQYALAALKGFLDDRRRTERREPRERPHVRARLPSAPAGARNRPSPVGSRGKSR
jgi:predicted acylesterase/phospholipase RssA